MHNHPSSVDARGQQRNIPRLHELKIGFSFIQTGQMRRDQEKLIKNTKHIRSASKQTRVKDAAMTGRRQHEIRQASNKLKLGFHSSQVYSTL
jgi:hypothetical protein